MSRRRRGGQDDSLDLLLDTVSNVFGGVMFLTLLAALLIMTQGARQVDETPEPVAVFDSPTNAVLIANQIRQASSAVESQRQLIKRLDPDGTVTQRNSRLKSLEETIQLARVQVSRNQTSVAQREKEMQDQQIEQSDLEAQIAELEKELEGKSETVNQMRAESERTVEFRPLNQVVTAETVVVLRYGRWYMLHESPRSGRLNREDFYLLGTDYGVKSITPKPHKGYPVNDETLKRLTEKLRARYPTREFHVTVAVWDDSFAEFNPLRDALKAANYRYRTIPCDNSSRLTNQGAVPAYAQ